MLERLGSFFPRAPPATGGRRPPAPRTRRCPPGWSPAHTQERGFHSLSLLPVPRSTETPLKWRCRYLGAGIGRSAGGETSFLPSLKKGVRNLRPPCQWVAWLRTTCRVQPAVSLRSTPQQALSGQLHRGLCTSGAPQRSVGDLNLGRGTACCGSSPVASPPRARFGDLILVRWLLAVEGTFLCAEFS